MGRPRFKASDEQRRNVEILVGLGIPQKEICQLVRDRNQKPVTEHTLRRHFKNEIAVGEARLQARVGQFMVATIFGTKVPEGTTPIKNDYVRGNLLALFLKARCGWTDRNALEGNPDKPLYIYQANKTDSRL